MISLKKNILEYEDEDVILLCSTYNITNYNNFSNCGERQVAHPPGPDLGQPRVVHADRRPASQKAGVSGRGV